MTGGRTVIQATGTRKGCKPTTGRYETREELEYWVHRWYQATEMNAVQVARACGVSAATVYKILERKRQCKPNPDTTPSS